MEEAHGIAAAIAALGCNTDDPTKLCNTFRMWVLLTIFVIFISGVNQFFALRYPSICVNYVVAQLLAYPVGRLTEFLPAKLVSLFGYRLFSLNPGKFSTKEHAVITAAVSVTASSAYAMNVVVTQTMFYKIRTSLIYQLLLVVSSQTIGFGVAGLSRRWLVFPGMLAWPEMLVPVALFQTLFENHDPSISRRFFRSLWHVSRYKFYISVSICVFVWSWFPGFLFQALSYLTIVCWIFPRNVVVNQLFGYRSGLGILPLTLDWQQVVTINRSPLACPWWVIANTIASVILFFFILCPALYYKNVWGSSYLPMLSSSTYDNRALEYNASRILNSDFTLNTTAYASYSPMYLPLSYSINYGLSFAAVVAVLMHYILYHGPKIYNQLRHGFEDDFDLQYKLCLKYRQVPWWWFIFPLVATVSMAFALIIFYDVQLPVWGLVVALLIPAIFFIPQGILEGITNQQVGLNVITEFVAGYLFPGKPIANLMVKLYGFIPMRHGLEFCAQMKLGLYMKLPPRVLFASQLYGSLLAAVTNVFVFAWMRANITDLCDADQKDGFNCMPTRTMFNASIIWGVVGPRALFSPGSMYHPLLYFFAIGAVVPVIFYLLRRRFKNVRWLKYVCTPILFSGASGIPPGTGINYTTWALVGFIFNYYIKRHYKPWWRQYNYVLSAALDTGVAFGVIIIFFTVQYTGATLDWWGNSVFKRTADWTSQRWKVLGPDELIH
ncbi:hypothetical protein CANCADRAFT_23801 [Tortispora caseinolytica NRRL Y-17796]|uniref:OPT family small oligopeptide transporter n=1 Tax=Tortispora caseinolytica NRRL Y-17796 TaxID=767744 RepID=A0A1E4TIC2_9ASCO|nr:hypothetical protein CANCADRAFT_23801 [Tortispora caseinolytica NRRL Y-17796]